LTLSCPLRAMSRRLAGIPLPPNGILSVSDGFSA
jgi:hypothetical protein